MIDAIALLEGGMVKRLHATPHHQDYSVARHSWGMATLLYALHPNPSKNLIWSVLFHDVAERWMGDIPAPAKWASASLDAALGDVQQKIHKWIGLDIQLTVEENLWLHWLDILELYMFCLEEEAMGSCYVDQILRTCGTELKNPSVPREIYEWHQDHKIWARTSDTWNS